MIASSRENTSAVNSSSHPLPRGERVGVAQATSMPVVVDPRHLKIVDAGERRLRHCLHFSGHRCEVVQARTHAVLHDRKWILDVLAEEPLGLWLVQAVP